MFKWCRNNDLILNGSKSFVLHFNSFNRRTNVSPLIKLYHRSADAKLCCDSDNELYNILSSKTYAVRQLMELF